MTGRHILDEYDFLAETELGMPRITAATVAEHREQTHAAILDAAFELIAARGYEDVSLGDVAARAGVTRTAIYNYVDDKLSLMVEVVKRGADEIGPEVAAIAEDDSAAASVRLEGIVRLLFGTFARSTRMLLEMRSIAALPSAQKELAVAPFRDGVAVYVIRVVEDGIRAGEFEPVADLRLLLELMVGTMEAAVGLVLADASQVDAIAEATVRFLRAALQRA